MAIPKWLWSSYEYMSLLLCGIVIAFHDSNPVTRIRRRFFDKLPSAPEMRDQALNETKIEENKQKAAIVTGGNSGIGLETCYFLMKAGFQIVIGCRSAKAGEEAVAYLKTEAASLGLPEPSVQVIPLDLSSQQSISEFAKEVKQRKLPVSLLVNNAGVMFVENWLTKEGYEVHFGVNHLGHFKLTLELLDVLAQHGPARIVTVTSDTYTFGNFDLSKVRGAGFHRWYSYCDSKLMNLLAVRALHRHLQAAGLSDLIKIYAVHPGSVSTGITRGTHSIIGFLYSLTIVKVILNLLTARDGASGTVYTALSSQVANQSGQYFATTYMEQVASSASHKEKQEDQLLQFSEQATNTNLESVIKTIKRSK